MVSIGSSDFDDRLSALPDDLICRVLCFLSTKVSVSTSVLAKRWRLMWAHVPNLYFNSENQNIINRVMMRLKVQDLKTFRLSNGDCSSYDLESWITTLIDRNVRILTIVLTKNPQRERKETCEYCHDDDEEEDMEEYYENLRVKLPRGLFSCKTLVQLRLANCQLKFPMTGTIYLLPALKILHLESVRYGSDESLPRLLSCCPVLLKLTILRDRSDEMSCCHVSSPKIKKLILRHLDMQELKLDTPALRCLKLGALPKNPLAVVPPSLTEACFSFNPPRSVDDFHKISQFVSGFYNVNSLLVKFCGKEICGSKFSDFNVVKFHNLTQLELNIDYRLIPKFIESADILRVLTISFEKNDLKCWVELEQVPACLVSNLEIVKIVHFGCTKEKEFNLIRYFLRNAKVLKKMEICCKHQGLESENINEAHEKISLFERVSEACELVFL